MKKQIITWTAIPHGLQGPLGDGGKLGVSVFVSPRLHEDGTPRLGDFPAWEVWPRTLSKVKFEVRFAGGPTIPARVVSPKPDMDLWHALFTHDTPVNPFEFENRTNQLIRSFPVARLQNDLVGRYLTVIQGIAENPGQLPDIRSLFDLVTPIVPRRYVRDVSLVPLDKIIDSALQRHKAIPPDLQPGGVAGDYHQVDQFMHRKTVHEYTADPATHPPRPKKSDLIDLFDFHKMISALGNYPELLIKLGLVVELVVPFTAGIRTGGASTTISLVTSEFNDPPNVRPQTHYLLDETHGFRARPEAGSNMTDELLLRLSDKNLFDITQMDLEGTAVKWLGMAANVIEQTGRAVAGLSESQGVPSLRSAGISLIHTGRAYDLAQRFQSANDHNNAAMANTPVDLHADDLVRGYAVDIWDKLTDKWHSLSLRNGTFSFKHAPAGKQKLHTHGEGFVTMATAQTREGTPSDLYLHEQVYRWNGWSLAAARPITPISSDGSGESAKAPPDINNPDVTRFGLVVNFTAPDKSLPKLRFGHYYKTRARMVDIAGHSIAPSAAGALLPAVQTSPIFYARWEAIAAPSITLRHSIKGSPGESTARLVIRSDFDRSVDQYYAEQSSPTYNKDAERHFLPPKTSQSMAETHGMFDTSPPSGKTWYQVITETDVNLPMDPKPPYDPLPQNTDYLTLPYMPDPMAAGATFVGLPGMPAGKPFTHTDWGSGTWPYRGTFRLLLKGIGATATPHAPDWSTNPHPLLTIELPKGEIVTVRYSSRPVANALALMAMWDLIVAAGFGGAFKKYAEEGVAWLLTPYHEITLVHAVQRPLIKPSFSPNLRGVRRIGDTSAVLVDSPMPISGRSTIKLDFEAHWYEPNDDVTKPGPTTLTLRGHVSELPLHYTDTEVTYPSENPATMGEEKKFFTHEFSNTKYHRVAYVAVATTRYREYFPFTKAELDAKPDLITRSSANGSVAKPDANHPRATSIVDGTHPLPHGVIDVPSSARPASPILQYIIPTFTHETGSVQDGITTVRRGGSLRVYLERPWFSSGEGELLGVVLPPQNSRFRRKSILHRLYRTPDASHITQWGLDPIWDSRDAPTPFSPTVASFTNAVRQGNGLTIDEQPGRAVAVAGHDVSYDPDRRLWYSDIELNGGAAYYPFVRLVLARYQPNSIPGAHLSRLVLADFAQIAPNRTATVVFDSKDPRQMRVAVQGPAPYRTTNRVEVSLEQQAVGANGGDPDIGWIPVDQGTRRLQIMTSHSRLTQRVRNTDTVWVGEYTLPNLPTPLPPLRLVVREYEVFQVTSQAASHIAPTSLRLVYAEVLDVLLPG